MGELVSLKLSVLLSRHMADNPSLKPLLDCAMADAYGDARIVAADETGFAETTFPATLPWSFDEIMNPDFWPE